MATASFDLTSVEANRRRLLAAPRAVALAGVVIFALLDARFTILGLRSSVDFALASLAITVAFMWILLWVALVSWAAGPTRLDLTPEAMVFGFKSGRIRSFHWNDPQLDVSVIDFSNDPWDKTGRQQPVPMYLDGIGTWRSYALTMEAGGAVLSEARSHGLSLSPGGARGSLLTREYGQRQTHIRGRRSASLVQPSPDPHD
ncbi:MAG TPA: hypothetical protein VMG81_03660 [Thermoplasmata archaeon]|nr:hypothetical protein [Thermoplasmata archaeon]